MVDEGLKLAIEKDYNSFLNKIEFINELREIIHNISPLKDQPVDFVKWINIDNIQANDYNPNSVASKEMGLLYTSIKQDGYTQPIVTIADKNIKKHIIVDGFHRYFTGKKMPDIQKKIMGCLPIVTIEKNINDRMASTIRHNRARGVHAITGMSTMVFEMLKNGWKDEDICNELGMDSEELLKLKHITGFSKLFENVEFKKAWKTTEMIDIESKYKNSHK